MKKLPTPVLVSRRRSNGREDLDVAFQRVPNGSNLHWHDHYELEIVVSGNGTYSVNGEEYPLRRGSV